METNTEKKKEIKIISREDADYPQLLHNIDNPPQILYCCGDISLLSRRCVAVVGSRKATGYGRWVAFKLSERMAEHGICIVSGMAAGIDSYSHRGALKAGGATIAVLGTGVDICYPAGNRKLRDEIKDRGLLISEYPPGSKPTRYSFPLRNRIISGLCEATVIAEAGIHSGSLITAERAAEQGRNVYAVPGNINSIYSIGTNKLIRDGAMPIAVIDDLLDDMGITKKESGDVKKTLGEDEKAIYSILEKHGETTVDYLCEALKKPPSQVNGLITVLEMKGITYTSLGKIFIAK